jgi:hypothetical protein
MAIARSSRLPELGGPLRDLDSVQLRGERGVDVGDPSTDPIPLVPVPIYDGPFLLQSRADLVQIIDVPHPRAGGYGREPVGLWRVF